MARKAFTTTPTPMRMPQVPQFTRSKRRAAEREGVEIRPLAGPEIPLPAEEDEEILAQYDAWNARTNGSLPEFIVWRFLVYDKKLIEGSDFYYQAPFGGGRTSFGGYISDFLFPIRQEIWNVQGLRWHVLHTEDRARDMIAKMMLTSQGYKVLELWEDDLLTRPEFVLNLAWDTGAEVAPKRSG